MTLTCNLHPYLMCVCAISSTRHYQGYLCCCSTLGFMCNYMLCRIRLNKLHSLHNYPQQQQQHGILHLTSYYESKRFLFCYAAVIDHPSIHPVMSRVIIKFDDFTLTICSTFACSSACTPPRWMVALPTGTCAQSEPAHGKPGPHSLAAWHCIRCMVFPADDTTAAPPPEIPSVGRPGRICCPPLTLGTRPDPWPSRSVSGI